MEELVEHLSKNKKVEIERLLPSKVVKRYKTALYNFSNEEFYFYKPKENDVYVDFEQDEYIKVVAYSTDGIYTFSTSVSKNGTKLLRVYRPIKYKKIQRRGYLRVKLPIKVKIEFEKNNEKIVSPVDIVDISGSGISFNTDCDLLGVAKLLISFRVEDKDISSYGEIVEVRKNRKIEKGKFRLSVRFVSLNKNDMDFIIKHCLLYQIKTRIKLKEGE